jgi:hypothetical protein
MVDWAMEEVGGTLVQRIERVSGSPKIRCGEFGNSDLVTTRFVRFCHFIRIGRLVLRDSLD